MKFVFFSFRNFSKEGGGTIRMYGLLNTLAEAGNNIVFISNASNYSKFHSSINHISIGHEVSTLDKAIIQGLLAVLPYRLVGIFFPRLLSKIETALSKVEGYKSPVYFFEYLDNTLGYILKKRGAIQSYINDIHGIATLEFEYQYERAQNLTSRFVNRIKLFLADKLDKKVFREADGIIYASQAMKEYYQKQITGLELKKSFIIPNAATKPITYTNELKNLTEKIKRDLKIDENDFVFLFAGGYKPTAGVDTLIMAFSSINQQYKSSKLILIGDGPLKVTCKKLAIELGCSKNIIFISKVSYENLIAYQKLSNVIVCPDIDNPYSHLIIHLKYFDALNSNRLVLNGNFKSVLEINENEKLSLTYDLKDNTSLQKKLMYCIKNYNALFPKYNNTSDFVNQHLTYSSYISELSKYNHK